ncbi:MAG: hypothetical protein WCU88_03940 [Elusimicrobiota bacterium]|jgi:hypothetical protein
MKTLLALLLISSSTWSVSCLAAGTRMPEVSASSGPVKIGLRVEKTRLRRGEFVWAQLSMTNLGRKPMLENVDTLFRKDKDFGEIMATNAQAHRGIYLVMTAPNGSEMLWHHPFREFFAGEDNPLKDLNCLNGGVPWPPKAVLADTSPYELRPGQTIKTGSWFDRGVCTDERVPLPKPHGDLAELSYFHLEKPGIYKLHAAYNETPYCNKEGQQRDPTRVDYCRKYPEKTGDWNVVFQTVPIIIEVLP